jgi:hypothetical protein
MERGELRARRRKKALEFLRTNSVAPHLNTTDALWALDAECGPKKFHRILHERGLASPVQGDGGYEFHVPPECGFGSSDLDHGSFQWSPVGLAYIADILRQAGIAHAIPSEPSRWLPSDGAHHPSG